jgi:RNA methyltransferase, TrmH family
MPVRIVQSKQNSRLKELARALAQPGRGAAGPVAIEGPNLVEEALRSGVGLHCVFAAQDSNLDWLPIPPGTELILSPAKILKSALLTENPQPLAALIDPPPWTWAHLAGPTRKDAALLVVLAGLQDPGNLGTILRSVEAFGAGGVLSLPGTVSAWNPKAVRASAGSVFRVPVLHLGKTEALGRLREAGIQLLAATMNGAQLAPAADLAEPVAFLIGNEGNGVPEDLALEADAAITIPCPGPVESLNAAVAASVLLYEASRQRASVQSAAEVPRRRMR